MEKSSPLTETPEVTTSALLNSNLVPDGSTLTQNSDNPLSAANKIMSGAKTEMSESTPSGGDWSKASEDKSEVTKTVESQKQDTQILGIPVSDSAEDSLASSSISVNQRNQKDGWEKMVAAAGSNYEMSELDTYSDDDDYITQSGDESDIEDNDDTMLYPGQFMRRDSNPVLPQTATVLQTDKGCKVYLVGTAHFSKESQADVAQVIQSVQPDVVMVELCSSRINILQMEESSLLEEAKNINFEKIQNAIKQSGVVQGIMHLLLLSMSAHITKQLGMAPGGEFRTAFKEARKVPGCRVHLGDRPIQITLRRAIGALTWFQKLTLAWYMIFNKEPISKEEVEKCKQKDLLEEMLAEMTGEYPALSEVFVHERDLFLTNSLQLAAEPLKHPEIEGEVVPSVVVGVVGMGHCKGIVEHWNDEYIDLTPILQIPKSSLFTRSLKWILRGTVVGVTAWIAYKVGNGWILPLVWSSS